MTRRLFGAAALLSLLIGLALSGLWAADRFAGFRMPPVPSTDRAAAALRRPFDGFSFTGGGRLQDLLGSVRSSSRVPLRVDWDALEAAGMRRTARVDYRGYGTCLGEVLAHLTANQGLAFTARGDTLLITTRAALGATPPPPVSVRPWRLEWDRAPHRWTLTVHDRALHLWRTPIDPALAFPPTVAGVAARQKQSVAWSKDYRVASIAHGGYPYDVVTVTVSLPALTAAASPMPVMWVLAALRRACRRHKPGVCRRCGYDLRATPERCPECGTVAGSHGVRSTTSSHVAPAGTPGGRIRSFASSG